MMRTVRSPLLLRAAGLALALAPACGQPAAAPPPAAPVAPPAPPPSAPDASVAAEPVDAAQPPAPNPEPPQRISEVVELTATDIARVDVTPLKSWSVGKWPEGIAVSEDAVWVSESGARRVARLARGEGPDVRVAVGRLPVDVVLGDDGTAYALVATDRKIVAIDGAGKSVKTLVETPDHAQALSWSRGLLWALLWREGSSAGSTLLRIDDESGETKSSGELGPGAFDVAEGHGRVWIARDQAVTVVDAQNLDKLADIEVGDRPMQVLAGEAGVHAGTAAGVVRIEPGTSKVSHRLALGQRVAALAAAGEEVAAITASGTIYLLDARRLTPRVALVAAPFEPRAMVAQGGVLYVTTHQGKGAQGSVHAFQLPAPTTPTP